MQRFIHRRVARVFAVCVAAALLAIAVPVAAVFAQAPTEVWVEGDWASQADVDLYDDTLTWEVNAWASIQEGVDAVGEDGTVNVLWFDGEYGTFYVGTNGVSVVGHANPDDDEALPVVGGPGTPGHPAVVHEDNVGSSGSYLMAILTADGVTVRGLEIDAQGLEAIGVMALCYDSTDTLLDSVVFTGKGTRPLGGIWLRNGATATLSDSLVTGCGGPAIHVWDTCEITILDSDVVANEWHGVRLRDSAVAYVERCRVNDNGWGSFMGGFRLTDSSELNITSSEIRNSSWNGIKLSEEASVTVTDCDIVANRYHGISAKGADTWRASTGPVTVTVVESRVTGNGWYVNPADGIHCRAGVRLVVIDSQVDENRRDGINARTSTPDLSDTVTVIGSQVSGNARDGINTGLYSEASPEASDTGESGACEGSGCTAAGRSPERAACEVLEAAATSGDTEVVSGGVVVINSAIADNGRNGLLHTQDEIVTVIGSTISGNEDGVRCGCNFVGTFVAVDNNFFDNSLHGVLNDSDEAESVVDCRNNWWGDVSGPYHETLNAEGVGDVVGDGVQFEPWLGSSVVAAAGGQVSDGSLDAKEQADTEVVVTGTAKVYVALLSGNPGGDGPVDLLALGKYIDVYVPDAADATEIGIRVYYTQAELDASGGAEGDLVLFWWDGSAWVACSDSGVTVGPFDSYRGYIWARIDSGTTPSLTDLGGTPFTAFTQADEPPPARPVAVGGEAYPVNKLGILAPWLLGLAAIATALLLRRRIVQN